MEQNQNLPGVRSWDVHPKLRIRALRDWVVSVGLSVL
jgi:hypothetical protein